MQGSGIKRNETVQQGLPCVRYGELYTTYQTSFTTTVSFIASDLYEKCKHFSYGDVLMTRTDENKSDIANGVSFLVKLVLLLVVTIFDALRSGLEKHL